MAFEDRFRVHKVDGKIVLQGIISDTTNFNLIDEMLQAVTEFDCKGLLSASWNGIIRFDNYLRKLNRDIKLKNVPNHIFKYLRLMPAENCNYQFDDIELYVIDPEDKTFQISNIFISEAILEEISENGTKGFLQINKIQELVGRDQYNFPKMFRQKKTMNPSTPESEFDFWFDYLNFSYTTCTLSLDLIQSLASTLQSILKDIKIGISQSEEAVKIISNYNESQIKFIVNTISYMSDGCEKIAHSIKETTDNCYKILLKMQVLAHQEDNIHIPDLHKLIYDFANYTLKLKAILSNVEDLGASTGQKISEIDIIEKLKKVVKLITDDKVSSEDLEKFRDMLEIMDPLSEDSWVETREYFIENLDSTEDDISNSIVLLQGFDLLRQILEHRLSESEQIILFVNSGTSTKWIDIRDDIYRLVNKTLVTDQEKLSCDFFIPQAINVEKDSKAPGDVLLF